MKTNTEKEIEKFNQAFLDDIEFSTRIRKSEKDLMKSIRLSALFLGMLIGVGAASIIAGVTIYEIIKIKNKSFADVSEGVYEITSVLPKDAQLEKQYQVASDSVIFYYRTQTGTVRIYAKTTKSSESSTND